MHLIMTKKRYTSPGHHLYNRKPSSAQMVSQFEIFNCWCFIRNRVCESWDHQLVQNPGNVPFAVISYIRRDWKRSCHWDDFSLDHQKISNKKPFTEKKFQLLLKLLTKGKFTEVWFLVLAGQSRVLVLDLYSNKSKQGFWGYNYFGECCSRNLDLWIFQR